MSAWNAFEYVKCHINLCDLKNVQEWRQIKTRKRSEQYYRLRTSQILWFQNVFISSVDFDLFRKNLNTELNGYYKIY